MKCFTPIILVGFYLTLAAASNFGCGEGAPSEPDVNSTPEKPVLLNPFNTTAPIFGTDRVPLIWFKLPDVVLYEIIASRNSEFSNPEFNTTSPDTSVTTTPLPPGKYYWKVRGQNSKGLLGEWSETRVFRLGIFNKSFGGRQHDVGYSVDQTSDGGYILTGYTSSFGDVGKSVWLIKTDESGAEEWNRTFGGSEFDIGHSVQQTSDGGYIVAGVTASFGAGGADVWLIKTDGSGAEEWNQTFGTKESELGYSVRQTFDGGYILTGWRESGTNLAWLIKTNGNGVEERSAGIIGDGARAEGYSVQQAADGGYVVAGVIDGDFLLAKTDLLSVQWLQTFGGSDSERATSVMQTIDGGFIITGWTRSFGAGNYDIWLIKTDNNGVEQWNRTFGTNDDDFGYSVQQTSDGGYIVAGSSKSSGWLIKTDSDGLEMWSRTFGNKIHSVQQTADGGYVMTGETGNPLNVFLIKTDENGNL